MTLSPIQIYWIMQADTIITCLIALMAFIIICLITNIVSIFTALENSKKVSNSLKYTLFFTITMFILDMIGLTFYPSTKTQATMYVVPAIVNNEKIQGDASEIYNLGIERLKEVLLEENGEPSGD